MTPAKFKPVEEQLDYLLKGIADIVPEQPRPAPEIALGSMAPLSHKLGESRRTGAPLRVKLGVDPTTPDIHLGHTVVIRKLKHFQDMGHTAIFLIGDFTAMVGDPTGQSETRPPLTREQVTANAQTYLDQVFKILDRDKTEVRYNSEWLGKMTSYDIVRLCGKYRVARMLEREDFRSRLRNNQPISMHELLYPLFQAYDSVVLEADVELGATEQKFNLLMGRDIQREYWGITKNPQIALMMPILVGLDGVRKMSKSLGNYIGISESPSEMFGKMMSIPDELMWSYWELVTDRSENEIREMKESLIPLTMPPIPDPINPRSYLAGSTRNPMDLKMQLAREVVSTFHGEEAARKAAEKFQREVREKLLPEDMPVVRLKDEEWYQKYLTTGTKSVALRWLIAAWNLAPSLAEAERLIKAGAVEFNDQRITDPRHQISLKDLQGSTLRVGKRKFTKAE
jgi:tyrosyl-tRNA synthetase